MYVQSERAGGRFHDSVQKKVRFKGTRKTTLISECMFKSDLERFGKMFSVYEKRYLAFS